MLTRQQQEKEMRRIIATQSVGLFAYIVFSNGFMLAYLSRLGYASAHILALLSLPHLGSLVLMLPCAYLSDRIGKKRMGNTGVLLQVVAYVLITASARMEIALARRIVLLGIILFAASWTLVGSGWFALLVPIVPRDVRGRFFGKLRFVWQGAGLVFTLAVMGLLKRETSTRTFEWVLAIVTLCSLIRLVLYLGIPEVDKGRSPERGFFDALSHVIRIPNYMPFCSYSFLLLLFTGACPWLFGLMQKEVLGFSDDQIVLMGALLAAGMIAGFYAGGRMVDRFGTKPVFLICHFSFGGVLVLFTLRGFSPLPLVHTIGLFTVLFGLARSASSVAISSEMLGLVPKENRSLSTGLGMTLQWSGVALGSLISSQLVRLKTLSPSWSLLGQPMSQYDTIIAGCAIMVVLLVVTLGLVPSVIRKAQVMPRA